MNFKLTILGLLLYCSYISAQNNGLKFRNYGIRDGLSQSTISSIFQDDKGFMWFGTSDGLNQFDGYKFKVYKSSYLNSNTLSDNWIGFMFEDKSKNLWVLTVDKTFNRINLKTKEVTRFAIGKICPPAFPQVNLLYHALEDKRNNIWFSTDAGIFRFNSKLNKFEFFEDQPNNPSKLKGNLVYHFCEDNNGDLWLSSLQGLYNYTYKLGRFTRYMHQEGNPSSLLSTKAVWTFTDHQSNLWILTYAGLSLYNNNSNTFVNFPFDKPAKFEILKRFHPVIIDKKGNFWIGTADGLYFFDSSQRKYTRFEQNKTKNSISNNHINHLYEDQSGNIWIGTSRGLNRFSPHTGGFEKFFSNEKTEDSNYISSILEDSNKEIFTLGAPGEDNRTLLCYLNKNTGVLEVQRNDKCNPNSIESSYVMFQSYKDRSGSLWFGSFGDGIIQYAPKSKRFETYYARPNDPNYLDANSVWGFAQDDHDNVYIPLYYNGLDVLNLKTKKFTHLGPSTNKLLGNCLSGITKGVGNDLWISTTTAGILRYNTATKTIKQYNTGKLNGLQNGAVRDVVVEPGGNLWIARLGNGLEYFNIKTETSIRYQHIPNNANSLTNNDLWAILRDKQGNIWVSCDGAIDMFNPVTNKFVHYKSKSSESTGILADKALCIFEDSKENIWFGTSGGGLSMLNLKTNKFRHWTENEGMPNNVVYGILEDEQGYLWLSTNNGLSRFDVKANKFWNFTESDGLQSNEFNHGACYKSPDNKLYFGGINGFSSFYPKQITRDTSSQHTVITGLQIFNRQVPIISPDKRNLIDPNDSSRIIRIKDAIYLPYDITYSKEITLTYREKVFTLEYAALSYAAPERTTYRYKMENFDTDWNEAGNRRFATYTNLPAGEYTFMVTASNASGIWNPQPTMLKIKILPPLRQTWYFYLTEVIFIIGVVIMFMRLRFRSLKHAKEELEKKVNARTYEIKQKNEELELRNLQIMKQKEEIALQAQQIRTELTAQNQTSELALLRSQINPHFLFNTLNNIYSLVYQRSENAPEAVMRLSEIMRYMLYEATSEKVLLENEIKYLKSFIELQQLRIKNNDFVSFTITGNFQGRTISPMLFIAFVENAFKHGVKRGVNPGIIINLEILDNKINFEVINYHRKNDAVHKDITGGIGLTNIRRRLELLHPNKFKLDIVNQEEMYHVKLQIEE